MYKFTYHMLKLVDIIVRNKESVSLLLIDLLN